MLGLTFDMEFELVWYWIYWTEIELNLTWLQVGILAGLILVKFELKLILSLSWTNFKGFESNFNWNCLQNIATQLWDGNWCEFESTDLPLDVWEKH